MTFPQALVFVLKENTLSLGRNLLERQNMYDTNDLNGKYPSGDHQLVTREATTLQKQKPTFLSGSQKTVINVTISTITIGGKIKNWKILEAESLSNHQYICFDI